ncbi:MAG: nitroreductase family protein [Alphaproteobacteria bacterium]|nr:nitroreductase family protein [Alphaproteobacteria bacterium]
MYLEAGLLTRRSVRKFVKNHVISDDNIRDLLKIAMYAPSGCNKQPWEFIVVNDRSLCDKISDIHPYAKFLRDASLAVVVCGNEQQECAKGHWITDTSAAIENLLLACHGLGLGACWCGIYPDAALMKTFSSMLNLPDYIKPNALVVIGYPLQMPSSVQDRFREDKIHYNQW